MTILTGILTIAGISTDVQSIQLNLNSVLIIGIGTMIAVVSYFLTRTLKQIDFNQASLFKRLREMELNMQRLQTEHDFFTCKDKKEG